MFDKKHGLLGCLGGCFGSLGGCLTISRGGRRKKSELPPFVRCTNWSDLSNTDRQKFCGVQIFCETQRKEYDPKWINQDSYVACVVPVADDCLDALFVGVFDGHGPYGHEASQIAASRLKGYLAMSDKHLLREPEKAFKAAFDKVDGDIYEALGSDVEYSGTTACVALIDTQNHVVHFANVGDSRAVIARTVPNISPRQYEAIQLTEDAKPWVAEERHRILKSGGIIAREIEKGQYVGPERVWDSDSMEQPGVAFTRSLGDGCARRLGIIPTPVVTSHFITHDDAFLLVATDGVWDSLEDNTQAISSIAKNLSASLLLGIRGLISTVRQADGGVCIDDTTCVVVKISGLRDVGSHDGTRALPRKGSANASQGESGPLAGA